MNEKHDANDKNSINLEDNIRKNYETKSEKQKPSIWKKVTGYSIRGLAYLLIGAKIIFSSGCITEPRLFTSIEPVDPFLTTEKADKKKENKNIPKIKFDSFEESEELGGNGTLNWDVKPYLDVVASLKTNFKGNLDFDFNSKAGIILDNGHRLYFIYNGDFDKKNEIGGGYAYISLDNSVEGGLDVKVADYELSKGDEQYLVDVWAKWKKVGKNAGVSVKGTAGATIDPKNENSTGLVKGTSLRGALEAHGEVKVSGKDKDYGVVFLNVKGTAEPEYNQILASAIQELYTLDARLGFSTQNEDEGFTAYAGINVEWVGKEPANLNNKGPEYSSNKKIVGGIKYTTKDLFGVKGINGSVGIPVTYNPRTGEWVVGVSTGLTWGAPSKKSRVLPPCPYGKSKPASGDEGNGGNPQ